MACSLKSNILIYKVFHKDKKVRLSQLAALFYLHGNENTET